MFNERGGVRVDTTRRALRRGAGVTAIYNTAGANRAGAAALRDTGRAGSVAFVGHELTEASAALLREGVMTLAIDQAPELQARRLRCVLVMLRRRVVLLDPVGGLAQEMAAVSARDVPVAVAFRHCAREVVAIRDAAAANGASVAAITDSPLLPLARQARVLFTVPEDEYSFSRSLAGPMCLVRCFAVATGALLQPDRGGAPRIATVTEIERDRGRTSRPTRRA